MKPAKLFYLLILFFVASCSDFNDASNSADKITAEQLEQEYAKQWEEHYKNLSSAGSANQELLPLEERKRIAKENGITEKREKQIRDELSEFAEKVGFSPDEASSMIETPYFFVNSQGEIINLEGFKAAISYAMYTRKFYEPFDERINDLYEEYSPHFSGETSDSNEKNKAYSEYKNELEKIKKELNEAKENLDIELGPWFFRTHQKPVSE